MTFRILWLSKFSFNADCIRINCSLHYTPAIARTYLCRKASLMVTRSSTRHQRVPVSDECVSVVMSWAARNSSTARFALPRIKKKRQRNRSDTKLFALLYKKKVKQCTFLNIFYDPHSFIRSKSLPWDSVIIVHNHKSAHGHASSKC